MSKTEIGQKTKRSLLDRIGPEFEFSRGHPMPLGATPRRNGINFALFSRHATSVSLVLFEPNGKSPMVEFPLDPRYNRTGDIWHAFIRGLDVDIEYGYRADCQPNETPQIHRFDATRILSDPYAKALSGGERWGESEAGSSPGIYRKQWRSVVVDDDFDWGFDQPLNIPMAETIIYELHVRGFTRHSSSQVDHAGTYTGLVEKIPYLKELGVTAIELLPINEFSEVDTDRVNPLTGERLLNFWGYNSVNFFSPKAAYSSQTTPGQQVAEFKSMVKSFHEAGLEVILDVVFNHTAEGNERGPTLSFRGLDNSTYYLIDPQSGEYHNYSGCGNALNCNHPVVRDMILECLRYWVTEMHVDGFRFDLASVLGRGRDGSVLANPPLLERIAADPILGNTKLIAEAWDAAGLYQVGTFPSWGRWAEWNGRFRDEVRRFVKSDPGVTSALASRLMGSPDIYADSGRHPYHSINFITCHDGFTLADLVSYNHKHNEANGEDNRDGGNDNNSWNCGWEGDLDAPDLSSASDLAPKEIAALRLRQTKNLAALLLLSRGVPMIMAGDEFGRTQGGNNNAYCQDNEISWVDWRLLEENHDLHRFFKLMIAFRKSYPGLRHEHFGETSQVQVPVTWHGTKPEEPDWSEKATALAVQIGAPAKGGPTIPVDIYLAINAGWEGRSFELPTLSNKRTWYRFCDTTLTSPNDICESGREAKLASQSVYPVGPRSLLVLVGR